MAPSTDAKLDLTAVNSCRPGVLFRSVRCWRKSAGGGLVVLPVALRLILDPWALAQLLQVVSSDCCRRIFSLNMAEIGDGNVTSRQSEMDLNHDVFRRCRWPHRQLLSWI